MHDKYGAGASSAHRGRAGDLHWRRRAPAWRKTQAPSYLSNFAALRAALGDAPGFDAATAAAFGLPRAVLDHHRRRGRLHRAAYGVYRFEDQWLPDLVESIRIMALPLGPDAVASHATALTLHDCTDLELREYDFIVPRAQRYRRRRLLRIRTTTRPLPAEDVTVIAGVRTTTLVRTILDAAKTVDPYQIEVAVYEGHAQGVLDVAQLRARIARAGKAAWVVESALKAHGLW